MRKIVALLVLNTLMSCSQEQPTLIKFELDKKGSYAIQYREADGTFTVMDSLEILGGDVFEVSFDTLQMISFLPIQGELPCLFSVGTHRCVQTEFYSYNSVNLPVIPLMCHSLLGYPPHTV